MEIIALVLVLAAVFAMKAVSILHWQDEEVAKSVSFSWTKPDMQPVEAVPVAPVEVRRSTSWAPSTAASHLRTNRWAMPIAR